MNICFVLGGMYGLFNKKVPYAAGGSEKQLYLIAKGLEEKQSYGLSCCAYDYGQPPVEIYDTIKVYKTFSLTKNKLSGFLTLIKVLLKIKADVYITRSPGISVFFSFLVSKYILKKRMWYMLAHDCETDYQELKKEIGTFPNFLMKYVYKHADIITVQTRFQQKALVEKGVAVTGIIPNIYDFKLGGKPVDLEKKKTILWVGRCETWKQPELFIEMARKYPDEHFVMVCPEVQNKSKYAFWDYIAGEAKKEKNIDFHGYLPGEKLFTLYAAARVYVITSLQEGFSNSMMEAMEHMCPTLSLCVNPDNILDEYTIGYCSSGEKKDFYQKFEKLLSDSELCRRMGQNARDYLYNNHTKEKILERIESIIGKK